VVDKPPLERFTRRKLHVLYSLLECLHPLHIFSIEQGELCSLSSTVTNWDNPVLGNPW